MAFIEVMGYAVWSLLKGSYLGLVSWEIYCRGRKFSRMVIFDPGKESSKGDGIGVGFSGKIVSHRKTQRKEH